MMQTLIGILFVAFAGCAVYGFLYVCQWLECQLEKRELSANCIIKRRQDEWQSRETNPDKDGPPNQRADQAPLIMTPAHW